MNHVELAFSNERLLDLAQSMIFLRAFDERLVVFHRHGRVGNWPLLRGHEAIQVGATRALRPTDWIFPSYREGGVGMLRGLSPSILFAAARGHHRGFWDPRPHRVAPLSVPVGSHVSHAVGFAWGERLQGRDTVALAFFGDGATSEGDFHEGANFAALTEAPVVLLCSNNQWAISTPLEKQTRAARLADKGMGYGIPAERVDGNDIVAVYDAVHRAAERARRGQGPTLIECVTFRPLGHAVSDDASEYRDEAQMARAREQDPVEAFAARLLRDGIASSEQLAAFRHEARERMNEAIAEAEAMPAAGVDLLFENTLAEVPAALARDRELVRELAHKAARRAR
ncbi:3-methyl-2-oxobutanoate dehydrogenase [Pendulispora rubella]|uniref:2-oxoisovalerate dehydrogenase subunit alpha n=1 Tax=Pendulispora rubella TaxID=2741070 RepID=A0ABZ2LID0_9BACT